MVYNFLAREDRGGRWALTALLLCLNAPSALSQEGTLPTKTGPQQCSSDDTGTVMGYENTTTLMLDMLLDHDEIVMAILESKANDPTSEQYAEYDEFAAWQKKQNEENGREWVYELCPDTTIDLGDLPGEQNMSPIIPSVMNSVIRCGESGSSEGNCVVKGGTFQVVFEDDFRFHNVTFEGITFVDGNLLSVAAYSHPYTDATFVDCIWTENNSPLIVDLGYDPEMDFLIEPGAGRRRMADSNQVSIIGTANIKSALNVDGDKMSKILDRAKNVESRKLQETYPGMMMVFRDCKFLSNFYQLYGILNVEGYLELDGSTFEQNVGIAVIVVTDKGRLAMHGGTKFVKNRDVYGPVFLDGDSELVQNQNVQGQDNRAIDVNGVPIDDACSAIFKENAEGIDCLAAGGECAGKCCDFGMPVCFTEAEPELPDQAGGTTPPPDQAGGTTSPPDRAGGSTSPPGVYMPASQGNKAADDGGGGGCDTTCIVIATVVPVCTIALVLFGVWFVRRSNQGGKSNANYPSPVSEQPAEATPPPPTMEQVEAQAVEPKFDHEHSMA